MLTKDDLAVLQYPFKANEHKFLQGNAYIREDAITERIEQIDPAWEFHFVSMTTRTEAGASTPLIVCVCNLIIKGVTRSGVGMAEVTLTKKEDSEANEAEKSAATDALKRAARLFGIGRYLLTLPKTVNDVASLRNYLVATYANVPQSESTAPAAPQPPATPPITPNPFTAYTPLPDWFATPLGNCFGVFKQYALEHLYNNEVFAMKGSLTKRGITSDKGAMQLTDMAQGYSAGEVYQFLANRQDGQVLQPKTW